jgi:hypothetical protein
MTAIRPYSNRTRARRQPSLLCVPWNQNTVFQKDEFHEVLGLEKYWTTRTLLPAIVNGTSRLHVSGVLTKQMAEESLEVRHQDVRSKQIVCLFCCQVYPTNKLGFVFQRTLYRQLSTQYLSCGLSSISPFSSSIIPNV